MTRDRLVFLHGFTQTHHHWHPVARLIAAGRPEHPDVAFVDLPGHGLSVDDHTPLDESPPKLTALAGRGTWIGYSMGARFALTAACAGYSQIERLVLIGGTAGLADPAQRAARRADDEQRADRLEQVGVTEFIDEWLAMPMFAGVGAASADRPHRIRNGTSGLAASLRGSGTGVQRSVWNELDRVSVPVLVLAGETDDKFVAIGQRLADRMRRAVFAPIPGAGHAAHAEQPAATAELITSWLRHDAG